MNEVAREAVTVERELTPGGCPSESLWGEGEGTADYSRGRFHDNLPDRWWNAPPSVRKYKIDQHVLMLPILLLAATAPSLLLMPKYDPLLIAFLIAFFIIFVFQVLNFLRKLALIEFRKTGIYIHPHDIGLLRIGPSPLIDWNAISYVSATYQSARNYEVKTLNISLDQPALNRRARRWLYWYTRPSICLLFPGFWMGQLPGELAIKLDRDFFTREDDPLVVMSAIKAFVDPAKVDPSVEQWTGLDASAISVTSLWLDKLSEVKNQLGELSPSTVLRRGRYQILASIGSGGQSVTYRAKSLAGDAVQDNSDVVLKEFILPVGGGTEITKQVIANIQRESRIIRSLDHPQIVRCLDTFFEGRRAYLVLNYIDGKTLSKVVEEKGKLSEDECISLAVQMCDILQYLHERQPPVVHRDFTPDNLMLRTDGKLELIDFNVAKQLESASATHTVVGKHAYIPPEQFRGDATTQSDIYALGCTMFRLLTGEDPEPISVSHPKQLVPQISDRISEIVAKATAQELSTRFRSVTEVRLQLEEILHVVPK
jgi:hypothetical protein